MIFAQISLVLLLAGSASANLFGKAKELDYGKLDEVCTTNVEITKFSHLQRIHQKVAVGGTACSPDQVGAIANLFTLLNGNPHNVCDMNAVGDIKLFYLTYIAKRAPEAKHLPESLAKLFVAYAMIVSKNCQLNFNRHLSEGTIELSAEGREKLDLVLNSGLPSQVNLQSSIESTPVLQDIVALVDTLDGDIYAEMLHSEKVKIAQEACRNHFRPAYGNLLLPEIWLGILGFNFRSFALDAARDQYPEAKKWYRIVAVCEAYRRLHVLEMSEETARKTGQKSRVLSAEEASKRKAEMNAINDLPMAVYSSEKINRYGNELVVFKDEDLMQSIKKFDPHAYRPDSSIRKVLKLAKYAMKQLGKGPARNKRSPTEDSEAVVEAQIDSVENEIAKEPTIEPIVEPNGKKSYFMTALVKVKNGVVGVLKTVAWALFVVLCVATIFVCLPIFLYSHTLATWFG